jgi:hypothetical protein
MYNNYLTVAYTPKAKNSIDWWVKVNVNMPELIFCTNRHFVKLLKKADYLLLRYPASLKYLIPSVEIIAAAV